MEDAYPVPCAVDGQQVHINVADRDLLVFALRDQVGKTSVHVGCESGRCGACTVLVNGQPAKSCMMLARQAEGAEITTLAHLHQTDPGRELVKAFKASHALQCGFCTPGMVTAAAALLERTLEIDELDVRQALRGNLCRCTGYQHIVSAVLSAADAMREQQS